jgi:hypothetical protein
MHAAVPTLSHRRLYIYIVFIKGVYLKPFILVENNVSQNKIIFIINEACQFNFFALTRV